MLVNALRFVRYKGLPQPSLRCINLKKFLWTSHEKPPFTAPLSISLNYKIYQSKFPLQSKQTKPKASAIKDSYRPWAMQLAPIDLISLPWDSPQDTTTENFLKNILDQTDRYRKDSQFIEQVSSRRPNPHRFRSLQQSSDLHF